MAPLRWVVAKRRPSLVKPVSLNVCDSVVLLHDNVLDWLHIIDHEHAGQLE